MKCTTSISIRVCAILFLSQCNSFTINPITSVPRIQTTRAFQNNKQNLIKHVSSNCNLIPISQFGSEMSFLSSPDSVRCGIDTHGNYSADEDRDTDKESYTLCVVEEKDIPDVSRFVINAFGADAIALSGNLSNFEKAFMTPAVNILNGYSGLIAYAEVYSGVISRTKDRLQVTDVSPPQLEGLSRAQKLEKSQTTSLILALARVIPTSDWEIEVIASVELRLQPCDAKIPFSFPWLDKVERKLADKSGIGSANNARDLQPYLSNLCVDEKFRGKKLGKALVRCVEDLATISWGYSKIYLHVDLENEPALNLYKKEGYKDVGRRWNPFWAGKAADIGYFVKKIRKSQ